MDRHYEGSHILFLESTAQSMSIQICISFFTIYSGSNICHLVKSWRRVTVGSYLNSQLRIQIVQLTCKRFHFCKCPSKCPLKNTEQMTWKKLVQGSHASSNLLPFFSRSLILLDSPFFFLKNTNVSSNLLGVFLTVAKIF